MTTDSKMNWESVGAGVWKGGENPLTYYIRRDYSSATRGWCFDIYRGACPDPFGQASGLTLAQHIAQIDALQRAET